MDVQERIRMSLLIEEMKKNKKASKKSGLVDKSVVTLSYQRTKGEK